MSDGSAFDPVMSRKHFESISGLMHSASKVSLQAGKEGLVKARLLKRIRTLGLAGFDQYLERVGDSPEELCRMVDLLATNKTSFFREPVHFDFMKARILPELKNMRLRVWSAGCSSGEEPYTIAMVLREYFENRGAIDVRVLATDLSKRVLEKAVAGVYDEDVLSDVPAGLIAKYFDRVGTGAPRKYSAKAGLRGLITFAPLNLMDEWPMKGPFDLVFCRNVMIYFDRPTQEALVRRFCGILKPGGYFFAGHSESLTRMSHGLRYVQPAVYIKQ